MANNNKLALIQKDTVDIVAKKVREFQERGELNFPANYSPENAMKAAWLTIQETYDRNKKPAIEVCTRNSIANALLKMVIQGLNPAKNQCYFIVYGNQLILQRSYFGSMHIAKTVASEIDDIISDVVYKGDKFTFRKERGRTVITNHEQSLENMKKDEIIAAYCAVFRKDGTEATTIMTIDEIKQSWKQSILNPVDEKGNIKANTTHGKFTAEMCKRTVINKACKAIINSSDDSNLIIQAYKETEAELAEALAREEIEENANKTEIYIDNETGEIITENDESDTPETPDEVTEQVTIDDLP